MSVAIGILVIGITRVLRGGSDDELNLVTQAVRIGVLAQRVACVVRVCTVRDFGAVAQAVHVGIRSIRAARVVHVGAHHELFIVTVSVFVRIRVGGGAGVEGVGSHQLLFDVAESIAIRVDADRITRVVRVGPNVGLERIAGSVAVGVVDALAAEVARIEGISAPQKLGGIAHAVPVTVEHVGPTRLLRVGHQKAFGGGHFRIFDQVDEELAVGVVVEVCAEPVSSRHHHAVTIDHDDAGWPHEVVGVHQVVRRVDQDVIKREVPVRVRTGAHPVHDDLGRIQPLLDRPVLQHVFAVRSGNREVGAVGGAVLHVQGVRLGHVDRNPIEHVEVLRDPLDGRHGLHQVPVVLKTDASSRSIEQDGRLGLLHLIGQNELVAIQGPQVEVADRVSDGIASREIVGLTAVGQVVNAVRRERLSIRSKPIKVLILGRGRTCGHKGPQGEKESSVHCALAKQHFRKGQRCVTHKFYELKQLHEGRTRHASCCSPGVKCLRWPRPPTSLNCRWRGEPDASCPPL